MLKRRIAGILALVVLASNVLAMPASAGVGDWDGSRDHGYIQAPNFAVTDFSQYNPRPLEPGEVLRKGIDVSQWNGEIDWEKVKATGVEFVFVRTCGQWAREEGGMYLDESYVENLEGALAAGLEVGAYVYSQAITPQEAVEEAQWLLYTVKDYPITLPLVLDYEYYSGSNGLAGRLYNAKLTKREATDICNAFCDTIAEAGYTPMVYSYLSLLNNQLYPEEINGKIWLANYIKQTSYQGSYEFWQFTSGGGVDGIKGNVDLNFWFQQTGKVTMPFRDVKENDWFYDSVLFTYNNKIVKGINDTTFAPSFETTRSQLVTMLYRMANEPEITKASTFSDLTGDWYMDAVAWAQATGVVKGISATEFGPEGSITREQIVTMLYRAAGEPKASGRITGFTDVDQVSSWAKDAMLWALDNEIIQGFGDGRLAPGANASRAEVTTFLMRYAKLMNLTLSVDEAEPDGEAEDSSPSPES